MYRQGARGALARGVHHFERNVVLPVAARRLRERRLEHVAVAQRPRARVVARQGQRAFPRVDDLGGRAAERRQLRRRQRGAFNLHRRHPRALVDLDDARGALPRARRASPRQARFLDGGLAQRHPVVVVGLDAGGRVGLTVDGDGQRAAGTVAVFVPDGVVDDLLQRLARVERLYRRFAVVQGVDVAAVRVELDGAVGSGQAGAERAAGGAKLESSDRARSRSIRPKAVFARSRGDHVAADAVGTGIFRDAGHIGVGRRNIVDDTHDERTTRSGQASLILDDQGKRIGALRCARLVLGHIQRIAVAQLAR